jgi:hypothetical protein
MQQNNISDHAGAPRHFGFQRKLYIFSICFILSSFIWIIIKLSRDYADIVVYPVVYSNLPVGKVMVNNPDSIMILQLKTKGFRILSNMLISKPNAVNVDVSSLLKEVRNSNKNYYILTSGLNQIVGSQLHYPNNIVSIEPDTLHFVFVKMYSKKVPVRINLNLSYAQQYEPADSIRSIPDSAIVSGPKALIDTIKFIETVSKSISNISTNQNLSLEFEKKYSQDKLTISPAKVKVNITVDKYTEAWVDLTISITNNPNNYIVRTFPEKTRVTYQVSMNKYKDVNPSMFSAVADISKAITEKSRKLKVEITKYPLYVRKMKTEPEKIEYIILK